MDHQPHERRQLHARQPHGSDATVKGVRTIAHLSFFGGYFQDAKNALPAFATNVDKLAVVYPELNITPAQIEAMKATRAGALIGRPLAKKYGWKVGDKIPVGTTMWTNNDGSNNWTFDIVGIFDPAPKYAQNRPWAAPSGSTTTTGTKRASSITITCTNSSFRSTIPPAATAIVSSKSTNYRRIRPMKRARKPRTPRCSRSSSSSRISTSSPTPSSGAVMFTLLFLTANTMMQSVRERIPELAVLRTLGFTGGKTPCLVLIESLLLCLLPPSSACCFGAAR